MFNLRTNFIFAPVRIAIKLVFKVIYKVLSLFHLQLFLFVVLVGLILFLTGVLTSSPVAKIITFVAVCFSLVYALITSVRSLLGLNGKKKKKFGAVEVISPKTNGEETAINENQNGAEFNQSNVNSAVNTSASGYGKPNDSYNKNGEEGLEKYFI